jgi:hypothetical protein
MPTDDAHSELAARVARIEDRRAVAETVQKYVRGLDSQNLELLGSIFAPDAVLEIVPWGTYEGRDAILADFQAAWEEYPFMNHLILNQTVGVDGGEATATSYWLSLNESTGGDPIVGGGYYLRNLRREDGEWVHARLTIDIQFLWETDGRPFRKVREYDELRPYPADNSNFPVPLFEAGEQ